MKMPKCARKTLFLHLKRMNMMKVQIINRGHQPLPAYATPQSAGMDLRANIDESIVLHPMTPACTYRSFHGFASRLRGTDTSSQWVGIETWHYCS